MTLSDMLAGGPGHDGYVYQADLYCVECGRGIIQRSWMGFYPDEDGLRDSERWPQPVFFGESECAQHCVECGEYLYGGEE